MREIDRENIRFLLTADPETFEEWFNSISEYEQKYALSLLKCVSIDLIEAAQDLSGDLSLAKKVIGKIKSKL